MMLEDMVPKEQSTASAMMGSWKTEVKRSSVDPTVSMQKLGCSRGKFLVFEADGLTLTPPPDTAATLGLGGKRLQVQQRMTDKNGDGKERSEDLHMCAFL